MLRGNLAPDQADASCSHDGQADRLGRALGPHLSPVVVGDATAIHARESTPDPCADQAAEPMHNYGNISSDYWLLSFYDFVRPRHHRLQVEASLVILLV